MSTLAWFALLLGVVIGLAVGFTAGRVWRGRGEVGRMIPRELWSSDVLIAWIDREIRLTELLYAGVRLHGLRRKRPAPYSLDG